MTEEDGETVEVSAISLTLEVDLADGCARVRRIPRDLCFVALVHIDSRRLHLVWSAVAARATAATTRAAGLPLGGGAWCWTARGLAGE